MMKKIVYLVFIIFLLNNWVSYSQVYGNEWINYNQKYFKFNIINSGVYKLDYTTLNASGIPLTTFQSDNIQIFGREKEVPLYIKDGGDSSIDPGDYILFYAEKNDGWLDSTLYKDPNWIGNPSYSLFNDTIQYFFTWNNSTSNLRFKEEIANDFLNFVPAKFIIQKLETSYNSYYNQGGDRSSIASSSFYMGGEGFGLAPQNGVNGTGKYTMQLSANTLNPYIGPDAP